MSMENAFDRWRRRVRFFMSLFYGLAGLIHLAWPEPFVAITPRWVPAPDTVVLLTGLCELAGAVALLNRRLRYTAAVGLALYAVCVYPANIKHAVDGLPAADASGLRWFYHIPRLLLQPILMWMPLFATGLVTWPFQPPRKIL